MKATSGKRFWYVRFVEKAHAVDDQVTEVIVRGDTASHAKQQVSNRYEVQYIQKSRGASKSDDMLFSASRELGLITRS